MVHVSVQASRPDITYKTGVVQPYPIRQMTPGAFAREVLPGLLSTVRSSAMVPSVSPATLSGPKLVGYPDFVQPARGTTIQVPYTRGQLRLY